MDRSEIEYADAAKQLPVDDLLKGITSRISSPEVTNKPNVLLSQDMKRLVKTYHEMDSSSALLHLLLSNPDGVLAEVIDQILNAG